VKKQEKSTKEWESQTPPYLPNGDRLGEFFCSIMFKNLINGGRSPPNPKTKSTTRSKCPCNQKTPNLQYLANPPLLGQNNSTTSFKTLENGGVGHFKTLNMHHN